MNGMRFMTIVPQLIVYFFPHASHHNKVSPQVTWEKALRQAWARAARTHTSHTGCVCALISLGHGCVQEVKNDINTVRFSHTNRSFCVLGHQCVVTMGNCLIWISLCMFFFPLIETVTYTCHYMTDRLERFWPKNIKIGSTEEKKTPTSWMPLG